MEKGLFIPEYIMALFPKPSEAVLLAFLINRHNYYEEKDLLSVRAFNGVKRKCFYMTYGKFNEITHMKLDTYKGAKKSLINSGVIEVVNIVNPDSGGKKKVSHFYIDFTKISKLKKQAKIDEKVVVEIPPTIRWKNHQPLGGKTTINITISNIERVVDLFYGDAPASGQVALPKTASLKEVVLLLSKTYPDKERLPLFNDVIPKIIQVDGAGDVDDKSLKSFAIYFAVVLKVRLKYNEAESIFSTKNDFDALRKLYELNNSFKKGEFGELLIIFHQNKLKSFYEAFTYIMSKTPSDSLKTILMGSVLNKFKTKVGDYENDVLKDVIEKTTVKTFYEIFNNESVKTFDNFIEHMFKKLGRHFWIYLDNKNA